MSCASFAHASFILVPAVGVADLQLDGAAVAEPLTPEGAMFQNPAGLVGFDHKLVSAGFGVSFGEDRIVSKQTGYAETDDVLIWIPSGGISVPFSDRWRFGVSAHGSAGASFDFPAQPPALENGFFTESAFMGLPFALAYELRHDVWLGAEIEPLFGYLRNRFALPDPAGGAALPVKYALRGPGLQGCSAPRGCRIQRGRWGSASVRRARFGWTAARRSPASGRTWI
jgi:long-subunit fatty acid transport protein